MVLSVGTVLEARRNRLCPKKWKKFSGQSWKKTVASDEEEQEKAGDFEASKKRKFGPYFMGSGKNSH